MVSFTVKRKDGAVEFRADFIFPELVVFGCLFNGTACDGNILVVHFL